MYGKLKQQLQKELQNIKEEGLYKDERVITNPQGASIRVSTGEEVLNFCANNYLGLSSHPDVIQAAKDALDTHGYGMSSVRFICGTQDIHKELDAKGFDLDKNQITIKDPIKALGIYHATVEVAKNIKSDIKLYVIKG